MKFIELSVVLAIPVVAAVLGCLECDAAAVDGKSVNETTRKTAAPEYDSDGKLKLPDGYRTWVFVGSSIGLDYRSDVAEKTVREKPPTDPKRVGDFHNVYINPEAYDIYAKTGKFPDKTVLVMEVYQAKDKEPQNIVQGGHFSGALRAVEVTVKNSNRPDGSKTDWAYYAFLTPKKSATAKAFKDATCYDCHMKHADDDNVWVQFYPTLRDLKNTAGK